MIDINFVSTFATTSAGLDDAFNSAIMPIFYDIGKVIFKVSFIYGIYYLMRMKYAEGVNRMKWAVIGYACLKMLDPMTDLVDVVTSNLHF